MKYGLKESVVEKICAVLAKFPQVEKAVLYGSRAKGDYVNGSDIDLTLCGGAALRLDILNKISNDLDDLLLPYTIDLSIFHDISDPDVVEHIQHVGMTFYARDDAPLKVGGADKALNQACNGKDSNVCDSGT